MAKKAKHTKAQQMMIDDGLPAGVFIPQAQRDEAWQKNPPRPMPAFNAPSVEEGEDTKAFRRALEAAQQRDRTQSSSSRSKRPERAPRPSREGLTSVGDIAKLLKVLPRLARAALRAAKVKKPDVGWAFAASDVERITKIIREATCVSTDTTPLPKNSSKSSPPERGSTKKSPSSRSTAKIASSPKTKSKRVSKKASASTRSSSSTKKRKR